MRTWKSTIRDGEQHLPVRHCVAIGCEVLVFNNALDATKAYNALAKALGRRDTARFTFKVPCDPKNYEGREYCASDDLRLALDSRHIGTQAEVEGVIEWHAKTTCDGAGVCSCWNQTDGHDVPDDWQEYTHEGTVKHMCPKCQDKRPTFQASC